MSQGIMTVKGREKMCKAHAGEIALPRIVKMAFGDGGVDAQGEVIPSTGEESSLKNELLRKDIDGYIFPVSTTCRYLCRLSKEDLANAKISEQGLIDEDGDLIAYRTFTSKGKDGDEEFIIKMNEIF